MAHERRPRARQLGIPFDGTPGPLDAVTDVRGVEVGHVTLVRGDGPLRVGHGPVRTGVTAILPYGRAGVGGVAAAGWHSANGNGEMTGTTWIEESGSLGLPVLVTNTHSVGACHDGVVDWVVRHRPDLARQWLLPVVGETWDGYLNDINGRHVTGAHAAAAIDAAAGGPVAEGAVGGGTGMTCYGFKGGSGTASRTVVHGGDTHTVGVIVQANFGRRAELTIAGVAVGRHLAGDDPQAGPGWLAPPGAGSVIAVVATDAPLLPGQLKAVARRVTLGIARTGTTGSHFSGDIALAFSTANRDELRSILADTVLTDGVGDGGYRSLRFVPWSAMDPYFDATVQATEEAVVNALVAATTMVGRDDHRAPGLPTAEVMDLLGVTGAPS